MPVLGMLRSGMLISDTLISDTLISGMPVLGMPVSRPPAKLIPRAGVGPPVLPRIFNGDTSRGENTQKIYFQDSDSELFN